MRAIGFPAKPVDGALLRTQLVASGVPVAEFGVVRRGGEVVVVTTAGPDDASHDAAVAAVYAAHVKPADETEPQARRRLAASEIGAAAALRAVLLELLDALRAERQAYNVLRADVVAGRTGAAVQATALPVPTVQQAIDAVLARIDALLPD